jgi:hypothetical protein
MPLYENSRNAENRILVKDDWKNAIVFGTDETVSRIVEAVSELGKAENPRPALAFEGWYGVKWEMIISSVREALSRAGIKTETIGFDSAFKSDKEMLAYKAPFFSDDPGFGIVNDKGRIRDLLDDGKLEKLAEKLSEERKSAPRGPGALIVYGPGSAIPELSDLYDLRFYFDTTKQSVLWKMWGGELVPFGAAKPRKDYWWKEYYYCDFYLLNEQKHFAFGRMDYYVQAIEPGELNLVPRDAFDGILSTLVTYPTKNVKYAQPGPWGAYRFKHTRWNIPGLDNNAWNAVISPNELAMRIDVGREKMIEMPAENLMMYPEQFVGTYIHKTYPRLIPFYIWLDDGYFPEPQPAERTSMPIHNHPGTVYVNRRFNEPLGRYETYYIAEAYAGANTWMGFKDGADLEGWECRCRESEKSGKPIEDWKDYVANWETNVGDLFLIPPGTSHGHGGNQMVIEMDTVPSVAGTEYSFFGYDFVRPTWDDGTKTMTARPMKMHLGHYFDNEKWRRASWVKEHLRARPRVVKWTEEYAIDRYDSLPEMPFEVERLHFMKRAEYDTQGRFIHMVALAQGERVLIRSKKHPERACEIEWLQGSAVPACFGEYELVNLREGMCTVVLLRWKKG